ncbi:MAG: hypothetical protein LBK47_11010, partial [Prevotellaceae bacterium]|nr:hypothetical protein [Prevotellaceae bacterium]
WGGVFGGGRRPRKSSPLTFFFLTAASSFRPERSGAEEPHAYTAVASLFRPPRLCSGQAPRSGVEEPSPSALHYFDNYKL